MQSLLRWSSGELPTIAVDLAIQVSAILHNCLLRMLEM